MNWKGYSSIERLLKKLFDEFQSVLIEHIPRAENKNSDALATLASKFKGQGDTTGGYKEKALRKSARKNSLNDANHTSLALAELMVKRKNICRDMYKKPITPP